MNRIEIQYPRRLVFGMKSLDQLPSEIRIKGLSRLFVIIAPPVKELVLPVLGSLETDGVTIKIFSYTGEEPAFSDLNEILNYARDFRADCIAGIGGGSVMDIAKLVAVLLRSDQIPESVVGTGLISGRDTYLICIPTTSGTGSEVSPNSIMVDEKESLKKGIISPFLVPDSVYIDPELMLKLPAYITAYTGMDALTHCIEAYANRNAHPLTDTIALEGIGLISGNLKKAVKSGNDPDARSKLALASLYGGMCLGPVNTGAVHALAYPLGSYFKIAHGISNALLLPYVMEFNLPAATDRYVEIARSVGAGSELKYSNIAGSGIKIIKDLIEQCGLPSRLSDVGIKAGSIEMMAESAITIQRLLKNNVRELNLDDIKEIYMNAL